MSSNSPPPEMFEHRKVNLFCLLHGSTQSASGWNLLVPELQSRGHNVVCVSLPSDGASLSGTDFADIIADSLKNSSSEKGKIVLVAHSASGLFLPLVPAECRVSRLVFLAAAIPQIGKSFRQQLQADPEMLWPDWIGEDPTKDDAVALHYLFHDCPSAVAEWALTTLHRTHLDRAMTEVCPIDQWPNVPSSFIVCREDRTCRPQWCRQAARERLGVTPIELPGGHCPHVSRPKELAAVLDGLVTLE